MRSFDVMPTASSDAPGAGCSRPVAASAALPPAGCSRGAGPPPGAPVGARRDLPLVFLRAQRQPWIRKVLLEIGHVRLLGRAWRSFCLIRKREVLDHSTAMILALPILATMPFSGLVQH